MPAKRLPPPDESLYAKEAKRKMKKHYPKGKYKVDASGRVDIRSPKGTIPDKGPYGRTRKKGRKA